ncbi:MAG TPA: winged helix-turn-helix domain-containing protein [Nitrososphaerales archaeon]|nr:winged helix-turn-helix domain-containing protein [Nitrososphaerales archaeon]
MQQLSDEELDSAKVMRIVNHPVRMRIIELLAAKPMSWKELSTEVGVKTGSLYHHLDTLEKIVTKDPERRYTLTRLGQEIFAQLNDARKTPAQSMQGIEKAMKKKTLTGSVQEIFVPRTLILPLTSTRSRSIASLVGLSGLALGLLLLSGDELILFSFSPSSSLLASVATYAVSLGALTAAAYIALAVAFKERGDAVTLLTSTALSFIPLCLFGAALHFLYADASPATASFPLSIFADSAAVTVIFAFFQAWGAGVMGAGMSVASGLRVEKTLVVSLVVLYATMLIIVLQGGHLT